MSEKKVYIVGTVSEDVWDQVHELLTQDGSLEDNIPTNAITCVDLKEHSPTRAVYLLTDEEADMLRQHESVGFVSLDTSAYPEQFPPNPEELHTANRYNSDVKNYRSFSGLLPTTPTTTDVNRAGYQILRTAQYDNPWPTNPALIVNNAVPNSNTGRNVDVIVGDDGCWFGHVEFNNQTGYGPANYVGGNKLPGNGSCDVLDLVLDGPYYIDPAWFDASPGTRLTTRWDGTIVPVESEAKNWWGNGANRSSQFASAGTVAIPAYYTRANCNGSNTAQSVDGTHGTACSGQAFGRTYGWAYNANKWFVDAIGNNGFGFNVDLYFDVVKIFHLNKPVNLLYGTQDPTISSNSWGWRATTTSYGYYYFRQGVTGSGGVYFGGIKPNFMYYLGSAGDGGRFKGEMVTNNLTTAGDELIAAGVIFVVAAGNSNQKQVGSADADYNNYWSTSSGTPLASATHTEFYSTCYNTVNRRGFPQQIGQYTSNGQVVYPAINIGALDDAYNTIGLLERKVNYSDMGTQIDCYAPGDGTLTSNKNYSPQYARYDTYPGATVQSYDCSFSGTSSACPTAAGMIATLLETYRSYTWSDVRTWLQSLTEQSDTTFYQGPDPTTATSTSWSDLNSLMGGKRVVLYNAVALPANVTLSGTGLSISGPGLNINF